MPIEQTFRAKFRQFLGVFILLALFGLFFAVSKYSYLLFHTSIESASIFTELMIAVFAFNTRKFIKNDFFLFLAISFLFIVVIQILHVVFYAGFPLSGDTTGNIATQLWLAERFLYALSFLAAILIIGKRVSRKSYGFIIAGFVLYTAVSIAAIHWLKIFPTAFVKEVGPTDFKIATEYFIIFLFLCSIMGLNQRRDKLDNFVYRTLLYSIIASILSEISFTLYLDVYGSFNMLGHLFLLGSVIMTYRAMISKTLKQPFETVFRDLAEANKKLTLLAERDGLTGLLNRREALERIKNQFEVSRRLNRHFSIIMFDVDNLKSINDRFGHQTGDMVLANFALELSASFRKIDIIGRYGGDEFIVCPIETDKRTCVSISTDFVAKINKTRFSAASGEVIPVSVSAGISDSTGEKPLYDIIESADMKLLGSKKEGKNKVTVDETK
ncbi:MAG: MASE3 domain-containing protein [Acidobacteriaceae bacterium]